MGTSDKQQRQAVRAAAGLAGGAALCALLAAASTQHWPVLLSVGLLAGAVGVYRRAVAGQAYSYWAAWAAAPVMTLLLLWAQPPSMYEAARLLALPWAAVSALVAAVLFALWHSRRDGHLDWLVEHPDQGVLRREPTRRAALAWARYHYGQPCRIFRLDLAPQMAEQTPMYPYADRPMLRRQTDEAKERPQ
ncbi:hypothetical protein ACFYZ8_33210 [Streptomyces sp. NPDC001668]|uniref:hypothetical protein n=1 Tax=Streptomyces sp. NPDC001668 TaxID=3364598 RepID=UPI00367BB9CB